MPSISQVADFQIRAVIDSGDITLTVTKPFDVVNATCRCSATVAGGTLKIQRSTDNGTTYSDVSAAITCATANNLTSPASVVVAQAVFAKGDVIKVTREATSAQGVLYIDISPKAVQ